ncbi:MAG: hypothetical protein JO286_14190 [Solirubrobacterales bacterium]|nr:hypothetical protein [Solirubrobacterales bacterium]
MLPLLVGLLCLVALAFLLAEFFIVFLLARRVDRDPAIARLHWAVSTRLGGASGPTSERPYFRVGAL